MIRVPRGIYSSLYLRHTIFASVIGAALLATSPTPVYAQAGELEEVIVTAQFRKENLQDTPLAITAVTDDMMRARSQDTIFQVTQQAPNVQLKPSPGPFGSAMNAFIRGIGQDDFEFAREPGVGIYIDDIYFPTLTGSIFEVLDLDRVEVLRGPQGTLQGRNSIGGAVRLITKKPTGEGGGYGELTFGEFNRVAGKFGGEFTILPDTLYARVAGVYNAKDGFQKRIDFACAHPTAAAALGVVSHSGGNRDCSLGTLGGKNYGAGRASIRWTPNDKLEVNIIADLTVDDSESPAQTLIGTSAASTATYFGITGQTYDNHFAPKDPYVTYETFDNTDMSPAQFLTPTALSGTSLTGPWSSPPVNHLTEWGIAGIIDYQINDTLSVKNILAYRKLDNEFSTTSDGSPFALETGWNHPWGNSLQEEFRVNATVFDGRLDLTTGVFYFTQDNNNTARIDLGYVPAPFAFDFITDQTYESDSIGVYGHGVYHFNDRLNLTVGLRYSDEKKYQELYRKDPVTGGQTSSMIPSFLACAANDPITGFCGANTFKDTRMDYRVSLDYRWNEQLMTYFTYSTGFKSGGVSPRFFYVNQIGPYGVETLDAFDVGFKSDLFDKRLRLDASGFYNIYKDQQVGQFECPDLVPPTPCLRDSNLLDSDIWGAEAEATWVPTDNLLINASLSWIQMKFTRIDPTAAAPSFQRNSSVPEQTPEWKFSVGASYEFSLGDLGSLTPRIDVDYEGDKRGYNATSVVGADQSIPLILKSYVLVNTRLTWRSANEDWEGSFALTNATDKAYFYNYFDISGAGAWASGNIAPPREWSFTLRRNF